MRSATTATSRSCRAASRATSTAPRIASWPHARAAWPTRWPAFGVKHGTRVATLAWNGHRHMELYYAVSGSGAVLQSIGFKPE